MDGTGRGPREPRGGAVCCTLKQIAGPQNRPSLNRQLGRRNQTNYQVRTASVGLRLVRPVAARPVRGVTCTAGCGQRTGPATAGTVVWCHTWHGAVQGQSYGRRQKCSKLRNHSTLNPAGHILNCKEISQRDDRLAGRALHTGNMSADCLIIRGPGETLEDSSSCQQMSKCL